MAQLALYSNMDFSLVYSVRGEPNQLSNSYGTLSLNQFKTIIR